MPEHTLKQFDVELEAVRARVLQMGGMVKGKDVRHTGVEGFEREALPQRGREAAMR